MNLNGVNVFGLEESKCAFWKTECFVALVSFFSKELNDHIFNFWHVNWVFMLCGTLSKYTY
jgi:hypothetical protein